MANFCIYINIKDGNLEKRGTLIEIIHIKTKEGLSKFRARFKPSTRTYNL